VLAGPRVAGTLLDGMVITADGEPLPQHLPWEVQADIHTSTTDLDEENVACLLPGAEPSAADTAIVLTAHYDHLGISVPDERGDSIYNGFSDNAAGVAMLLAVGAALAESPAARPRHSTILLFLTAEERGLLGSDYYVARPLWPLERTLAVINLDAGAPPGRSVTWRLAGVDSTGLGRIAIRAAARRGFDVTTSPARANSDYFPFHREGVRAVFVIPGPAPYEGLSADSTRALRARWDRYHQASDHWDPAFPFAGLLRYAEFALAILQEVDTSFDR
jgi:Zn-dependent M28 family amino/carboxypeptidase